MRLSDIDLGRPGVTAEGVTFRHGQHARVDGVPSLLCVGPAGVVELWALARPVEGARPIGGVEIHSRSPLADGQGASPVGTCTVLEGDPCYSAGETLTFHEVYAPMLAADDELGVLAALYQRWQSVFAEPRP